MKTTILKPVYSLFEFAVESNAIEGIYDDERHAVHQDALEDFLRLEFLTINELTLFVKKIQPNAFLRDKPEHIVEIGGRVCPDPSISPMMLQALLDGINNEVDGLSPWDAHAEYEYIHPFIDGNGRSGRALWLWMMARQQPPGRAFGLSFLHRFYYQTLKKYAEMRESNQ